MKYYVKSDLEFLLKGAFKELAMAERDGLKEGGSGKKGEGSRGGKIVGHTASGKPIYSKKKWKPKRGFTAKESGKIDQMISDEADGKTNYKKRG